MAGTIYISADRDRVYLEEVPRLIANALHPPLPDGTPRELSYLAKEARSAKLAAQWCGHGNNFPVSLTDADMQALNAKQWAGLPPLALKADSDRRPRELAKALTQPEWEPYAAALVANPQKGWRLVPNWRNLELEQAIMHHDALKEHEKELRQQAARGTIKPKSPTTGIEEPTAMGARLADCYLTVPEFEEYAGRYQLVVQLRREYVRRPLVADLLRELRQLPPDESVMVRASIGTSQEKGVAPAREWVFLLQAVEDRQDKGYFTLDEAAEILCEANPQLSAASLIERWKDAELKTEQRRLVRGTDKLSLARDKKANAQRDLVKIAEVDAWHASQGDDYRLSTLLEQRHGTPTESMEDAPLLPSEPDIRKTWWDVASQHVIERLREGRFATAKTLFNALHAEAGTTESPFDKGTGENRGSLFVRDIGQPLAMKTIQNRWRDLRKAAGRSQ